MLDDVFEILSDPTFQKPGSGLMSFPAYVYVYPPDEEYALRDELPRLVERLKRPSVGQEPLLANIYDQLRSYLSEKTLGDRSILERLKEAEDGDPDMVERRMKSHARSQEFAEYVAAKFNTFIHADADLPRTFVLVHGWGAIFPYLRASMFLNQMESHLHEYKLILFYPGTYRNGAFRLFGKLESDEGYRATCLNERISA